MFRQGVMMFYLKKILIFYHRPVNLSEMSIQTVNLYKKRGDLVINWVLGELRKIFSVCFPILFLYVFLFFVLVSRSISFRGKKKLWFHLNWSWSSITSSPDKVGISEKGYFFYKTSSFESSSNVSSPPLLLKLN